MRILYPILFSLLFVTNCNKEKLDPFCLQNEIEAFKLKPEARWIIQQDFNGKTIFTFGETSGGFIMNTNCELICPNVCLLCAHGGQCEGKDFYGATKNDVEIWRR